MDFLPISTYFESQATPLSKPHGYAILLTSVPSSMPQDSIAEAVESCPPVGIDDGAMGLKGERLACPGCPKGYGGQTDCYIFLYGSIFIFLFSYLFI